MSRWLGTSWALLVAVSLACGAGSAAAVRSRPAGLEALGDERLAAQVQAVIDSMDKTGRPPEGVAQGGRRHGTRGVFQNAEGKLPRKQRGYYTETDVWPSGRADRGAERLVFGSEGEVYYSRDHYRTFVQVR
jgi:ribonuclease T1